MTNKLGHTMIVTVVIVDVTITETVTIIKIALYDNIVE